MRAHIDRLGRPDAISWVTALGALVVMVPSAFLTAMVDASGRELEFFGVVLVRVGVTVAVLGLGWVVLKSVARTKPRPVITLTTFVVAIVLATTVFDALLVAYGFTAESLLARRLPTTLVGTLSALILSSLVHSYARDFSRSNVELRTALDELQRRRIEAKANILSRKTELISTIKTTINQELEKVDGSIGGGDTAVMQHLIDDVVRPLSYSLNRDFDSDTSPVVVPRVAPIDWTIVVRGALQGNPFHWIGFPVVIGLISAPFLIVNFGATGLLTVVVFLALVMVVMRTLAWCWALMPSGVPVWARVLIFTLTHIPGAFMSTWITERLSGFPVSATNQVLGFLLLSLVFSWSVALVAATFRLLRESNAQLAEAADQLKRELIVINASYRQLNKGIARVLHGPIQAAIASSMLRLMANSDHLTASASADMVRQRIAQALDILSEPFTSDTDVVQVMADLSELWSGVVEITYQVSPGDLAHIKTDRSASYALGELIREACSNATRHGKAKSISIVVHRVDGGRAVELTVDNDGHPLSKEPRPGIGSQLFDEQTLSWSRVQVGETVRVVAKIPLATHPVPTSPL